MIRVISLGGSVIVQDKINSEFLKKFKDIIMKSKDKFVIVTGGGKTARVYINGLKDVNLAEKELSLIGIGITRLNAKFMSKFFKTTETIPKSLKEVKNVINKNKVVFCGGLRYEPDNTSDGTAAEIARDLKSELINITDVDGLYTKDPNKFKMAKFIPKINFEEFKKIANRVKYSAGQHFVLDQHAAEIIKDHKIKTVILGNDLNNFERFLRGKRFKGTLIN